MSPVDIGVIRRKLCAVEERLAELEPDAAMSLAEYRSDGRRKKGAEKFFQELIHAAIDASFHILTESGASLPEKTGDSFTKLAELGILAPALAARLVPYAGIRNRLVHVYEEIDDEKVLASLRSAQEDFVEFVRALRSQFGPA